MHKLRVVISGQRHFGAAVYNMLAERKDVEIAAVFAPPGDLLYEWAKCGGCQVRASGSLLAVNIPEATDLLVAAHSHDFVSCAVRNRLSLGAIGYHPSLLPLHRGRDAVRWTVRDGDRITGGTVYWLNDTVDGGPIAAQEFCFVLPGENASQLWRRALFPMGLRLISRVLDDICKGCLVMRPQEQELASWEPSMDGAPPLFRPELPQIGMLPIGYKIIR